MVMRIYDGHPDAARRAWSEIAPTVFGVVSLVVFTAGLVIFALGSWWGVGIAAAGIAEMVFLMTRRWRRERRAARVKRLYRRSSPRVSLGAHAETLDDAIASMEEALRDARKQASSPTPARR